MDKAHNNLLARVGTALYQQVEIQQADLDAVYDEVERLCAEVEHLRAECHTLRLWAEEAAAAENANAEDAKKERAAVVAWLNAEAERVDCGHIEDLADRIERGEHRREEER